MAAKKLKEMCRPRQSIFVGGTKGTMDSLSDLTSGRVNPDDFFSENHFTEGMRQLCMYGLERLAGKYDTGVFRLKQAMGGGKTHNLIAFGLLAADSGLRAKILPAEGLAPYESFGCAKVVTFEGRDRPINGLWGHIAKSLGKESEFSRFYSPLHAPGKEDWANLIGDEPIVLMFDELPPYLQGVAAVPAGQTNLAMVTADAIANLLMAVQEKLPRAVVVITDLNSAWEGGSMTLDAAIKAASVMSDEVSRSAVNIEPVRLNSSELYDILRKRLFEDTGSQNDKSEIEDEFRRALEKAEKTGFSASAAFGFANEIASSYPFHPKLKELFARFKENEGFQQTRGIIRMTRAIVAAIWNDDKSSPWLISPSCANLNDQEVFGEFKRANPSIETAVMSDVANGGSSVAEKAGQVAEEVARTILTASLARGASQAKLGLSENELSSILMEPGRNSSDLKQAVENIRHDSLYLHMNASGDLFYRENKNLTAAIRDEAAKCRREDIEKELKRRLGELFQIKADSIHQDYLLFPDRAEIVSKVSWERITLAIVRPDEWESKGINELPDSLREVFEKGLSSSNRNRLALLSLGKDELLSAEKNIRELWAIRRVLAQRQSQGVPDSDQEIREARRREETVSANVVQSVINCPSHLHYPDGDICTRPVEKSRFVNSGASGANGAAMLAETLEKSEKVPPKGWETGDGFQSVLRRFQSKVFTSPQIGRNDLEKLAADNTHWLWLRPGEFERFIARAFKEDHWRESGSLVHKKPKEGVWPKPEPESLIVELDANKNERQSGTARISVSARNGDTVRWAEEGGVTRLSPEWKDGAATKSLWATFLAEDSSSGKVEAKSALWFNPLISVKGEFKRQPGGGTVMTLLVSPGRAPGSTAKEPEIFFTTDGSNPKNAAARKAYQGPVELPSKHELVQAVAIVEAAYTDADGTERIVTKETQVVQFDKSLTSTGGGDAVSARVPDASKPIRWTGGRNGKSFDDSGTAFRMLSFIAEKGAMARGGLLWFKSASGTGTVGFGTEQDLKPESISKLADLLQTEFGAEMQKLKLDEIHFKAGSDLSDFAKSLGLGVADTDWEQE